MLTLPSLTLSPLGLQLEILRLQPATSKSVREQVLEAITETIRQGRTFDGIVGKCYDVALLGHAADASPFRDSLFASFENIRAFMSELAHEARRANVTGPEVESLEAEAASLGRKLERLRAAWRTPDDLEDLAAQALVPSDEELRSIRDALPFPQAWLEPGLKPF